MKPARDWQTEMVQSKQIGGDFVPWIEAIQRDALEAAAKRVEEINHTRTGNLPWQVEVEYCQDAILALMPPKE